MCTRAIFSIIIALILLQAVSAVRINEVMHHTNNSFGFEWVELYNPEEGNVSLDNWKIADLNSSKNFSINISTKGFGIIIDGNSQNCSLFNAPIESCIGLSKIGSGLNDDSLPEKVFLYNQTSFLIDNMSYNKNLRHLGKSWQFCNNSWVEAEPTPGKANFCPSRNQTQSQNTTQNSSQNQNQQNSSDSNQEPLIYLELDWNEDDIINGEEFKIEVSAFNLENEDYDIKVYVNDDGRLISEIYDTENEKWISGSYYADKVFSGGGDESENLKLRIKSSYENFNGDAEITAKIRKSEPKNSPAIDEVKEDIEVLEKEGNNSKNDAKETQKTGKTAEENEEGTAQITRGVIELGNRQAEIKEGNVIYESKGEKIKKYSIYGLNIILIVMLIFLLKRKGFKTEFAKE